MDMEVRSSTTAKAVIAGKEKKINLHKGNGIQSFVYRSESKPRQQRAPRESIFSSKPKNYKSVEDNPKIGSLKTTVTRVTKSVRQTQTSAKMGVQQKHSSRSSVISKNAIQINSSSNDSKKGVFCCGEVNNNTDFESMQKMCTHVAKEDEKLRNIITGNTGRSLGTGHGKPQT